MTAAVTAEQISYRRGDAMLLREVNLVSHPGEVLGIIGRNGAGKTTTMRTVFGLVAPDTGTVSKLRADLIGQAAQDGVAVLVASSDAAELVHLCDRVLVMRNGVVTTELTGGQITEHRLLDLAGRFETELLDQPADEARPLERLHQPVSAVHELLDLLETLRERHVERLERGRSHDPIDGSPVPGLKSLDGLDDLARFPFTTKDDLRAHYPFGLFAVPEAQVNKSRSFSRTCSAMC